MATVTINPTSAITPDPNLGGLAVTSAIATGHASTLSLASGGTNSEDKSCRWTGFVDPGGLTKLSMTLRVGFTRSGTLSDGGAVTSNTFLIQYSLDSGSNWISLRTDTQVQSSLTSTDSVSISTSATIANIRVRDALSAAKTGATSASLTASVSSIRLEIETPDPAPRASVIVMM